MYITYRLNEDVFVRFQGLSQISQDVLLLAAKAKEGKLQPHEFRVSGKNFTSQSATVQKSKIFKESLNLSMYYQHALSCWRCFRV